MLTITKLSLQQVLPSKLHLASILQFPSFLFQCVFSFAQAITVRNALTVVLEALIKKVFMRNDKVINVVSG